MPPTALHIARTVSAALVGTVREIVAQVRPAFVLAKGGITSSDTATEGLGIRRAWSRGTMLPGIVSLWEPVVRPRPGHPVHRVRRERRRRQGPGRGRRDAAERLTCWPAAPGSWRTPSLEHSAVPAFATYNLEMVQAVVTAAEQTGRR